MENKYTVKVDVQGAEEATQKIETLADAFDGFPAQVVVKNCRDCNIKIYPSQTKLVTYGESDNE